MSNKQPSPEGKLRLYDATTESQEFRASQVRQLYRLLLYKFNWERC